MLMKILGKSVIIKFQINVLPTVANSQTHHVLKEHGNMKIEIMKVVLNRVIVIEDHGVQLKLTQRGNTSMTNGVTVT